MDPYDLALQKVYREWDGVNNLFVKWKESLQNHNEDEASFIFRELTSHHINLQSNISILEKVNATLSSHNIDPMEVERRKKNVSEIKQRVEVLRQDIDAHRATRNRSTDPFSNNKDELLGTKDYKRLRQERFQKEMEKDNEEYIDVQLAYQDRTMKSHEEDIEYIGNQVSSIKELTMDMGVKLDQGQEALDGLSYDIDKTSNRVSRAISAANKLLDKADNKGGWFIVFCLVLVLMVVVFLVIKL